MSAIAQTLAEPVARGHIYALGQHRLMCGDATCPIDVAKLCDGDKPTLVITSPPYADARDYNDPIADWDAMMMRAFCGHEWAQHVQVLVNLGARHRKNEWQPYWWNWVQHMRSCSWRHAGMYVWDKLAAHPGNCNGKPMPCHEFIFHFNKQNIAMNKTVPCKSVGREGNCKALRGKNNLPRSGNKTFSIAAAKVEDSVFRMPGERYNRTGHPAVYPISLPSRLIAMYKALQGTIVYDPFGGTATTLLACELEGARGLAMEISPAYVQMALNRWQQQHPGLAPQRIA